SCRSFERARLQEPALFWPKPCLSRSPSEAEGEVEGAEILTFPVSENHKKLLSALVSAALNIGGPPAHSSSFRRHPIVLPLVPAHAARPPVFRRRAIRRLHQLLKHNVLRPAARTAHSHLLLPLSFLPLRHVLRFVMRQSLQGPGPRNAHDLHGHTRRKI